MTAPTKSFMQAPLSNEAGDALAVILGLPYDCGSDPLRIGARSGPESIRQQSHLISPFDGASNINPITDLKVRDLGDSPVTLNDIELTFQQIEVAMTQAMQNNAVPITLGGDGAVALPQMRALSKKHPDLIALHFDAHTDAYPLDEYSNATPFTHAVHEQLICPQKSFHIGRRGSHFVPGVVDYCRELGYNLIDSESLFKRGFADVMQEVKQCVAQRPVYLCFDMDFFDPSAAPGVCSPTFGGATSREGLELLRMCSGLNIVGADVNTISPAHDSLGMSAQLAATVVYEIMLMLAKKRAKGKR
jgi:agmatinase